MVVKEDFAIKGSFDDAAPLKNANGSFCVILGGKECPLSTDIIAAANFDLESFLDFGSLPALCHSLYKSGIKAYDFVKVEEAISFTAEFATQGKLDRVVDSVRSTTLIESLQEQVRKLAEQNQELLGHIKDFTITSMQVGSAAAAPKTHNVNIGQSGGISMQGGDGATMAGRDIRYETNHNNQVTNTGQQGGISIQGHGANFSGASIAGRDNVTTNNPRTYNQGGQNYGTGNFTNSGTQNYGNN